MRRSRHACHGNLKTILALAAMLSASHCFASSPEQPETSTSETDNFESQCNKEPYIVFAASSLQQLLPELLTSWVNSVSKTPNPKNSRCFSYNFGSSSRLAMQIRAGAAVDLFATAHPSWIQYLQNQNLLDLQSTRIFASNRLVLAKQRTSSSKSTTSKSTTSKPTKDEVVYPQFNPGAFETIAVASASAPLGTYTKAALSHLGLWSKIVSSLKQAHSASGVLAWLIQGHVDAAVIYASDARIHSDKVSIHYIFPKESHPQINYVITMPRSSRLRTDSRIKSHFMNGFLSKESQSSILKTGFLLPPVQDGKK